MSSTQPLDGKITISSEFIEQQKQIFSHYSGRSSKEGPQNMAESYATGNFNSTRGKKKKKKKKSGS